MCKIHAADGDQVARANMRLKSVGIGGSSRGLKGVDWESWRGRVYLQQVTMLGHSFGAATTVEDLRNQECFQSIGQGIIYDI